MNCVQKNSKLESFLKRNLTKSVYDDIRYYEGCVVRKENSLVYMFVILTTDSLLLVNYPPTHLYKILHFSEIHHIEVMHDCPVFFKGPVRDNCQHICLKHQLKTGKFPARRQTEGQEEPKCLEGKSANTNTSKAITINQNRQTSTKLSKLISRIKSIEISSIKKHHLDDRFLKTDYVRDELNTSSRLKEDENIVCSVVPPKLERPLLQDCNNPEIMFEQTEIKENEDLRKEASEDIYEAQELTADVEKGDEQALDPCADICEQRSISVLLNRVEVARPHIPRSYSSLSQYPTNEYIPHRRSHSSLDKPKLRSINNADSHHTKDTRQNLMLELHLYVLHANTSLLIHLQTCWYTRLLIVTLQDPNLGLAKSQLIVCSPSHVERSYHRMTREIMKPYITLDQAFDILLMFQAEMLSNKHLKKIFWKDQMMYHSLTQHLQRYLTGPGNQIKRTEDFELLLSTRQAEMEAAAMVLDTLLKTLRDTDSLQEKVKLFQFNDGSVIQSLLVLLVTAPQIPFKYHNTCSRMIEDFRNFSSFVWNKLPEAELIRLQAEITNTATAVLYEILMTMERLHSKTLSISLGKLLNGLPFKCYVRRSVTQLLGLIFPIQPNKLQAVEAVLVYQHLFVIKCFMKNIPEVKDYIKQHFQEEFRYYICWSRVEHRLPDVFPVKSFVQQLVEEVHEMATQTNNPNMKSNIFS